jgi:murein DD-endopeptidase MepM/ murein hydrolase activator NlpD
MRILSTAASAAFVALVLTATASVPAARPRSSASSPTASSPTASSPTASSATASSATASSATASSATASSAQPRVARVGTNTPTGANPTRANTSRVAPHGDFIWPLSPRPAVLRPFDQPRDQWSPGHRGVDLLAAVGQPVLSAGDGIVAFSGVVAGRGVLTVQHSDGIRTTYEPVVGRLASGTLVHRGTPVGILSDGPGHCLPLHCLHWGAISGEAYRDPLSLLGFGRPVLLPLG